MSKGSYIRSSGHIGTEFRVARIRPGGHWFYHEVERTKEDGSLDWYASHRTRRAAEKAVDAYAETGEVIGFVL